MLDSELGSDWFLCRAQPEDRILVPGNDGPKFGWCQVHIERVHIAWLRSQKIISGLECYLVYEEEIQII